MQKRLITAKELAIYIGISREAIYQMLFKKEIPDYAIVRFGRSVRFDMEGIDKWIDENKGNSSD